MVEEAEETAVTVSAPAGEVYSMIRKVDAKAEGGDHRLPSPRINTAVPP